ncbi:MAG: response regulator [Desulfobulbaceae bacterium]|nr:response regulator [Desulfobulbaceae bacterium]
MLERLGYQVTARRSSQDALSTFQNRPNAFDMVVTDLTMPVMTGIDLARRIMQIRPEMPIILCTGYSTNVTEEKVKSMGIKGFVMKPLALKVLAELIRKILDEKNK